MRLCQFVASSHTIFYPFRLLQQKDDDSDDQKDADDSDDADEKERDGIAIVGCLNEGGSKKPTAVENDLDVQSFLGSKEATAVENDLHVQSFLRSNRGRQIFHLVSKHMYIIISYRFCVCTRDTYFNGC